MPSSAQTCPYKHTVTQKQSNHNHTFCCTVGFGSISLCSLSLWLLAAPVKPTLAQTSWQAQCLGVSSRAWLMVNKEHSPPSVEYIPKHSNWAAYESVHLCMWQEQLTRKCKSFFPRGWTGMQVDGRPSYPRRRGAFMRTTEPEWCQMGSERVSEELRLLSWPVIKAWQGNVVWPPDCLNETTTACIGH